MEGTHEQLSRSPSRPLYLITQSTSPTSWLPHHLPFVQASPESSHTLPYPEVLEILPYNYFCIYPFILVPKAPPSVQAFTTLHMDSCVSYLNQSPYFLSDSLSKNTLPMPTRVLPSKSDFTSLLKIDSQASL